MALKLKKNNKEIRDALQVATLKKKDNVCATIPLHLQRLRACQVITTLETATNFAEIHHLLQHLFNLFKRYYYSSLGTHSFSYSFLFYSFSFFLFFFFFFFFFFEPVKLLQRWRRQQILLKFIIYYSICYSIYLIFLKDIIIPV